MSGRAEFAFQPFAARPREAPHPQAVLHAAHAEADRIRAEAYQAGYDEGFAAGHAEALGHLASSANALAQTVEETRRLAAEQAAATEFAAVALALAIAEKVIAGALAVEPERVVEVVRGALRSVVDRERIVIQVNPDDLDLVRDAVGELLSSLGGIEHVEVQQERRVGRGGALVRTSVGEIDATIETKLARARSLVEAELGRASGLAQAELGG